MSSSSIYGSAASPITISGLGSGLNTSGIITALTANENTAITTYQSQQSDLNNQVTAWQTFNSDLLGLQSIASSLSSPSSFSTATASIDQSAVATVTSSTGAVAGTHTLTVNSLAQAQKVLSNGVTDASVPLNISGSFLLNGSKITVTSTESLTQVAAAINSSSAGVNASVISAGTGDYQLSLTSSSSGALNGLSASDVGSGTALESLGLLPSTGGTQALRQSITTSSGGAGAGSIALASSTEDVGAAMSITDGTAASGAIEIKGTSISVNLNTMSLTDVANAINSAGISGVQAQIVGIPDASGNVTATSAKQLQIVSTDSSSPLTASSFTDSNNVLSSLGIVQTGFTNQKSAAQDASFSVDGVDYTRSSNTVSDVIPGVSMTLLSTNDATTSTPANISVAEDTSSVSGTISNFVTAYNGVVDYINSQNTFTPDSTNTEGTAQSSPELFGNYALTSVQNQLSSMLNVNSNGKSLADVGITVNTTGELVVDSSQLQAALQSDPTTVASLFGVSGTATGTGLSFVTAGTNSQTSSAQGYAVDITQAATQATVTAASAYTAPSQAETLTFSGGLFSASSVGLSIPAGTTLSGAISLINGNTNLNQALYASSDSSGRLVITSKGYGSTQLFGVQSNLPGAQGSGIGTSEVSALGADVMGTINGEAATGVGQSLEGNAGNKTTDGVQITYTGTAIGSIGNITVAHGVADQLNGLVTQVTDSDTGVIASQENALTAQVASIQTEITGLQTEVGNYQSYLETTFAAMETAVANLKSQQQAFDAQAGITSTASSSSGSSSTSSSSS